MSVLTLILALTLTLATVFITGMLASRAKPDGFFGED
jgi:hypothetical protein